MAPRQAVSISTLQSWQQAAFQEHRKSCPHATLNTIHLRLDAPPQPTQTSFSLDAVLDTLHQLIPSWPASYHPPVQDDHQASEEQPSQLRMIVPEDEGQQNTKDETAFDTTQRIVAGQCTCCNTLFQLEILEKVGTIENANIELRKLQEPPGSIGSQPLSGKEAYGTLFGEGGVDYTPKSQGEVTIMYTSIGTYQ